jgi:microcystin-dependent protein
MANRAGFYVPNAGYEINGTKIASNRQAEPDAGDFSILGNPRYGVLQGFDYSISTGSFSLSSSTNIGIVDGAFFSLVSGSNVSLTAGGDADRFDLVVADSSGLSLITGVPASKPVFPEIPDGKLVVAAVFVPATVAASALAAQNVIDKRYLIPQGSRGSVSGSSVFLENKAAGTTTTFKVTGDGSTSIGDVTFSPNINDGVTVSGGELTLDETLSVNGDVFVTGKVEADGRVLGSNLLYGSGTPLSGDGATGSLYLDEQYGRAFIKRSTGGWAEIYADEYPPGTIISTVLKGSTATDYLDGSWLLCNGQQVVASEYPRLQEIFEAEYPSLVTTISGITYLIMPNLQGRTTLGASSTYSAGSSGGSETTVLTTANMPAHKHFTENTTNPGGSHDHNINGFPQTTEFSGRHSHTIAEGGEHVHEINDPGHFHGGADHGINTPTFFIAAMWGGQNKIDGLFNDSSHTWSVDISWQTVSAYTGVSVKRGGRHTHSVSEHFDHYHDVYIQSQPAHTHTLPTESTVGNGQSFSRLQPYFAVNYYIKA